MNKTLIALAVLLLVLAAIAGNVVLAIIAPAQLGPFNSAVGTVLGLGVAGIVTVYGLGQQTEKLKTIERNTNGNLTRMQDENTRLTNILIRAGIDPAHPDTAPSSSSGQHVAP